MRDMTRGVLELTVLLAVARLGTEAHGLAVRRDISTRTGREHSVGAVYTSLYRLEEKGLLASSASDSLPVRGGRARRCFTVTAEGQRALRHAQRVAASVWADVGRIITPQTG